MGKVLSGNSHFTHAFQGADDYVITPLISDKNYIPFLLKYCQEN